MPEKMKIHNEIRQFRKDRCGQSTWLIPKQMKRHIHSRKCFAHSFLRKLGTKKEYLGEIINTKVHNSKVNIKSCCSVLVC